MIPWLMLYMSRPDIEINEKITETDQALAQIAQIIFTKLEQLGDMAENFAPIPDNPLLSILQSVISSNTSPVSEVYERNDDGTFYGTEERTITEAKIVQKEQSDQS